MPCIVSWFLQCIASVMTCCALLIYTIIVTLCPREYIPVPYITTYFLQCIASVTTDCALHIYTMHNDCLSSRISTMYYGVSVFNAQWVVICRDICIERTRPRSFLGAGFRPRIHPFVWFVPLAELTCICTHFKWAVVDIRRFSVDGFDTRWIPRSFSCGFA